jgi:hypothetical protein
MKNIKNYLFPFIPIIGIYLVWKYNVLCSNTRPFVFFSSAFFQALSVFLLIFHILIKNVSN